MILQESYQKKIRLIFQIALSIQVAVVSGYLILSCLTIYRSGESPFTSASIAAQFAKISLPVYLFLLGICFVCELVVPLPRAVYPAVVIMGCMPCGLNTIVFPSLVGEDCRMGAKFVLLSHVLCLASIPLWIWIVT